MATAFVITDIPAIRPRTDAVVMPLPGRFSTGMERLRETLDSARVGRFSDGMQALFDSPGTEAVGRFSTGMEGWPEAPAARRVGSFADGYDMIRRR